MGSVERRLRRLEAETPVVRTEEEIRAAACRRMSTEDLVVLEETLRRLEELDAPELGWEEFLGELSEEEREAFEQAYARYEEAIREAREGR
ncbi:MAG: hypothetical protein CYG60_14735 [Actinobacteria bacterium]|nr:MAG: hypothetical protein CYG60_14735 [Actinomycetota bacterium]